MAIMFVTPTPPPPPILPFLFFPDRCIRPRFPQSPVAAIV